MPDWLTYVLSAWVACEAAALLGIRGARRYVGVAAVGSVLPDLIKISYVLKTYADVDLIPLALPLGTPAGAILVAGLFSSFFERSESRSVFAYTALGVAIHIGWDYTLHPYGGGQPLLFPLSFEQYALGWIWSDSILPLIIVGVLALILFFIRLTNPAADMRRTRRGL